MKRRDILGVIGVIISFWLMTSPMLLSAAYDEYIEVTVSNNNTSSYDNIPIMVDINNSQLTDYGYILATGLDTNWATGATSIPYSIGGNKAFVWASSILSNQQIIYNYQLGYSPSQTSYPLMVGYNGYLTISDAASLELGSDFEIELDGFINTASGTNKYILNKGGSLFIYVSAENEITAGNYSNENLTIANSSWEGNDCYATSWYGQTFTFTNNVILNGFNLYCKKVGAPAGNLDYYLYATSGGLPTGSALASGSILASTVSTSAGLKSLAFTTPVSLTAATTYAVVFSCPSGNSSNRISYWYTNNSSYAGGQQLSSSNSGASWTGSSTVDIYITLSGAYLNALVSASNVESDEHNIKAVLSGGTMSLYVDAILKDTVAFAGSITDNANNWILMQGNSVGYLNYYKHTVSSVQKCWYQPISLINYSAVTDRSGNGNSGVVTLGANPTGINITIGGLISSTTYTTTGAGAEEPPDVVNIPTTNVFEDDAATGDTLPAYGIFNRAASSLGITTPTLYILMFSFVSIVVFVAVTIATGTIVPGILAGALAFAAGASTTVSPMFLALFLLLGGIMLVYNLRRT